MSENAVSLDRTRLLGFDKLPAREEDVVAKGSSTKGLALGVKVGAKPGVKGRTLGSKIGSKIGTKT